jgi:fatty acid desaturase
MQRSAVRYLPRLLTLGAVICAGVAALVIVGNSWWQPVVAVAFGAVFAQLGFLGHDAGHQQVFTSRRSNDLLGLMLATLGVGLSYGWWVDKHNRHHRHPNEVGRDPDVDRNVLAWTQAQAREQRGVFRWVARHQAAVFFPLLALEAWNLHVGSVRSILVRPRASVKEAVLLAVHATAGLALLVAVMSPLKALAFIGIQQSVFGLYLGCSFAPNHKGMRILDGTEEKDFLRRQVLTARNVKGGRLMSAALGGLNYQIEHHLFPSMPSRNLRRCQPIVRQFCATHDVPYAETSLLDSYGISLRYLRSVGDGPRLAES